MFRLTIAALVVLILVALASPGATVRWTLVEAGHPPVLGDANYDGVVTVDDAYRIAEYDALLAPCSVVTDVNADGATNIIDALVIAIWADGGTLPDFGDFGCVIGDPVHQ